MNNLHSISLGQGRAIDDTELAQWLQSYRGNTDGVIAYIYAKNKCKVFEVGGNEAQLTLVNPEKLTLKELTTFANASRLKRIELSPDEFDGSNTVNPAWKLLDATANDVKDWYQNRENSFKQGRGKAISSTTAALVWHDAGGRCMYRGCVSVHAICSGLQAVG